MDIQTQLERAQLAAQQKDGYTARAILRRVIEQQPDHLEAWLLFAKVAQKPEHTVQCLYRVLKIDPDHQEARWMLAGLKSPHI